METTTPMNSTTSNGQSRMVTGLFRDRDSSEHAYRPVSDRGYSHKDIDVAKSNDTHEHYFSDDNADTVLGNKADEDAGIGGTIGTIAAAIAAVGTSLVIPGLRIVVAGPIAAAVAGAEALLKATVNLGGEATLAVRAKVEESLVIAKVKTTEPENMLTEKARAAARVTGDYVHENPWRVVGVAAGVSLVVGLLIGRR